MGDFLSLYLGKNSEPGRKIFHNKLACIIENNSMTYRYELCTSIGQPGLLDN